MNEHPVFIDPRQGEKEHVDEVSQKQNPWIVKYPKINWEDDAEYWYKLRNELPPTKRPT